MSDDEGFTRKSTRMAAIEAAKRIKKNAEYNAQKKPLYRDETVTKSDAATSDNNKQRQRGDKRKKEEQVDDSTEDSSNNISKSSDPSKSDDMPRKRRGRPPKPRSTKCQPRHSRNTKYKDPKSEEADYDVNQRRESYNSFRPSNDRALFLPGPKQLHLGDGGISYKESLMSFTKGLGPTAQNVALRMLQRQGPTHQARHQPKPLSQSPETLRQLQVVDLNSMNDSFKNTITNQATRPLYSFGDSNAATSANHKGKNIVVDDGKSAHNKWDVVDKLERLLGKQKGGVKIGSSGSLTDRDFRNKNLDNAQVGNQRTINQSGSFGSTYNANIMNQLNVKKISGIHDISGQKDVSWNVSNVIPNASALYPSTNVSRSGNMSNSSLGLDDGVSPLSWVLQPPMHSPTPVAPPAPTVRSVINNGFWIDPEFQLALALDKKMKDRESNVVRSQNLWAPRQTNQFLHAHTHGPVRQQPQDQLLTPMQQNFWSEMAMSAPNPEQHGLPYGTQQGSRFQMGNKLQHPPPGI